MTSAVDSAFAAEIEQAGASSREIPEVTAPRAIAILAVVASHVFPSVIHGGYLGVDLFFVISGFLITYSTFRAGTRGFSVRQFWRRRISRIIPALLAVTLFVAGVAWRLPLQAYDKLTLGHVRGKIYTSSVVDCGRGAVLSSLSVGAISIFTNAGFDTRTVIALLPSFTVKRTALRFRSTTAALATGMSGMSGMIAPPDRLRRAR
jgi:Acyltransferase family